METGSGITKAAVLSLNPRFMRAPEHTPGIDIWGSKNTRFSTHRPENGLPPRHTSLIRCKITDPETHHKFMKREWMTHCSLLSRTNSKSYFDSKTGLWCYRLQM